MAYLRCHRCGDRVHLAVNESITEALDRHTHTFDEPAKTRLHSSERNSDETSG